MLATATPPSPLHRAPGGGSDGTRSTRSTHPQLFSLLKLGGGTNRYATVETVSYARGQFLLMQALGMTDVDGEPDPVPITGNAERSLPHARRKVARRA